MIKGSDSSRPSLDLTTLSRQVCYSENCLLYFSSHKECCLKWQQAGSLEKGLGCQPSLKKLLPPTMLEVFKARIQMSQEIWEKCAPKVFPTKITVIPRGKLNAVKFSLNPKYPHDITHIDLCCIWIDTNKMKLWPNLSTHTDIELQPLLTWNPPVLIVMIPVAKLTRTADGQLIRTVLLDSERQITSTVDADIAVDAPSCCFERYVDDPCAFLLDVAQGVEEEAAARALNIQLK